MEVVQKQCTKSNWAFEGLNILSFFSRNSRNCCINDPFPNGTPKPCPRGVVQTSTKSPSRILCSVNNSDPGQTLISASGSKFVWQRSNFAIIALGQLRRKKRQQYNVWPPRTHLLASSLLNIWTGKANQVREAYNSLSSLFLTSVLETVTPSVSNPSHAWFIP